MMIFLKLYFLVYRIHTFGVHKPNDDHPDCRAVLYEETIYNKRKIHDFVNCLNGFKSSLEITEMFLPVLSELKSPLLLRLLTNELDFNESNIVNINSLSLDEMENEEGNTTDSTHGLKELIKFFDNSFVAEEARKSGKIIPLPGVDKEYDRAKEDIKGVEESLEQYISEQKILLCNNNIKYWYGGKMRYQIEVITLLVNTSTVGIGCRENIFLFPSHLHVFVYEFPFRFQMKEITFSFNSLFMIWISATMPTPNLPTNTQSVPKT